MRRARGRQQRSFLALDRHARVVGDLLPAAGEHVEKRGLAAVGISDQRRSADSQRWARRPWNLGSCGCSGQTRIQAASKQSQRKGARANAHGDRRTRQQTRGRRCARPRRAETPVRPDAAPARREPWNQAAETDTTRAEGPCRQVPMQRDSSVARRELSQRREPCMNAILHENRSHYYVTQASALPAKRRPSAGAGGS